MQEEKIENSKVERSVCKKKSKNKVVVTIVIVLVVAIIAGVAVLLRYSRCFDCGSFIFPGTVCSWCNDTVQSDEWNEVYYEYSDDDYQVIYTTSYITEELDNSGYVVGEKYSQGNKSLKNV